MDLLLLIESIIYDMHEIKKNLIQARDLLDDFMRDENNLAPIHQAGELMVRSLKAGGKIICCGNGGSMCDAMHFAEELTGRFRHNRPAIAAVAVSDPGYLTCAANDFGFESVFARFVEGLGKEVDVLLAVSTTGQSANVIKAAETARHTGMKVVGLTGKDGGALAPLCDVEVRAPYTKWADRVQEIHTLVIHCLIDFIERQIRET